MKKTVLCLVCASVVIGLPASAAAQKDEPRSSSSSPVIDLQRWLEERWQMLANPFRGGGDTDRRPPRGSDATIGDTCDPSRTKCPIG